MRLQMAISRVFTDEFCHVLASLHFDCGYKIYHLVRWVESWKQTRVSMDTISRAVLIARGMRPND